MDKNRKLIETINNLKEFNQKDNWVVDETIKLLQEELKNKKQHWRTLRDHITTLINNKQELAKQYNCTIKITSFSHTHFEEISIHVYKKQYSCQIFEIDNEHMELITELENILENELEDILKRIDKYIQ